MKKFKKLVIIFVVGCLFGYFYEVMLNLMTHWLADGTIFLERRSGVSYGPCSIIYGVGAVLMTELLAERNLKWWQVFVIGGLLCGMSEYVMGWILLLATGTRAWDYSDHLLNFSGMTSVPIMIVWGVVCLVFIEVIYPWISKKIEKIPEKIGNVLVGVVAIFLAIDMMISASAVVRMGLRHKGVEPITAYGRLIDKAYPDERVRQAYPSLEYIQ